MDILRALIGIVAILGIAYTLSSDKKLIKWDIVAKGLLIQLFLAVIILKGRVLEQWFAPLGWPKELFSAISYFFVLVIQYTTDGATFVLGDLAKGPGTEGTLGFFFAFQVLPTIIFFASLTALLYHYGILQRVVKVMAMGMQKILKTSGAESLSVVANVFVGQTEAPLVIKPYIERMTSSELLALMTGGMATIAGGVMAAYIQMLGDAFAVANNLPLEVARLQFAEQLLGASLMAAPAALIIAKIIAPEKEEPLTRGEVKIKIEKTDANGIDAATTGAADGLKLALNVGAMLLAFIALLAMFNAFLGYLGDLAQLNRFIPGFELNIQTILGYMFSPLAFLIGIPMQDALTVGSLLGTKLVLTEFIAYLDLASAVANGSLEPKTIVMATFALCGFANFSSIAIQIGGIGGLAPSRKSDLAKFGLKAVIAGSLANLMTATIAGMLY